MKTLPRCSCSRLFGICVGLALGAGATPAVAQLSFPPIPIQGVALLLLNRIEELGVPERAAFGYTPRAFYEQPMSWPRRPIIVPPMMVRDFNFTVLADAI